MGLINDDTGQGVVSQGELGADQVLRLDSWMARTIPDHAGPVVAKRFEGGQSNPTYRLDTKRRSYVLRSKPFGMLLQSAHAIEREAEVMGVLHGQRFPVPQIYGLCEDEAVIGAAFYVMELVEGRILWDPKLPDQTPSERRAIYDAQVDTLAALHRFEPAAIGLAGFGKPGNYFSRQLARWTKQYRASDAPPQPDMERLIEWLAQAPPDEVPPRIVHGDYRIDNLVLATDRSAVLAVLDWELCTLGDPIADLTYFLMMWRMPPGERIAMDTVDFTNSGIPSMGEALDRYLAATGRRLARPIEWYIAFNLFRLAAILQGVAGRAGRGQANNSRALQAQGRVGPLARAAWENARLAGAPA